MILVTGASGKLGKLAIASLIQRGIKPDEIIATVREPEKAYYLIEMGVNIRYADYDYPETFSNIMSEVDSVVLISSSQLGKRVKQHMTVIDAAKKASIKHIVYTSLLHADSSSLGIAKEHVETEQAIYGSGIPYTILRNGWYSENYTDQIKSSFSQGVIMGCAGSGRLSTASRADYAEAIATVLTSKHHEGKIYELAGDQSFTLSEYASNLSFLSGKQISYQNFSKEVYRDTLIHYGLPEDIAELLSDSEYGASKGELYESSQTLSKLIDRDTTPIQKSIKDALKATID